LGGLDEAAGIYDQDVGLVGAGSQFIAIAGKDTHHDLAVDEVFRAAQTDETYLRHAGKLRLFATPNCSMQAWADSGAVVVCRGSRG
jgi:hypothetical protein